MKGNFYVCNICMHDGSVVDSWCRNSGVKMDFLTGKCVLCGNETVTYIDTESLLENVVKSFQNPNFVPAISETAVYNNAFMGMVAETAEAIDHWKKFLFQGHSLDEQKIKTEIGDALYYMQLLWWVMGTNFSECVTLMTLKLINRFGDSFSTDKSINRED